MHETLRLAETETETETLILAYLSRKILQAGCTNSEHFSKSRKDSGLLAATYLGH